MNTFFRICFFMCLALITFNMLFLFVESTGAFPYSDDKAIDIDDSNALSILTGLDDPSMNAIWAIATTGGAIGAITIAWITHSIAPIGIYLFSEIFWTSYIHTHNIVNVGGYVPESLIAVFTVGILFVFIAAIIGMLTGSG